MIRDQGLEVGVVPTVCIVPQALTGKFINE